MLSIGALLRGVLLLWSVVQDQYKVKYTDTDYYVVYDTASLWISGESPYDHPTYRYPPLLALFGMFDVLGFGLFRIGLVLLDMVYAIGLSRLLGEKEGSFKVAVFVFNPVVMNLSTRGSFDIIPCLLVLLALDCVLKGRNSGAGIILGVAVYLRLYPIVFVVSFCVYLNNWRSRTVMLSFLLVSFALLFGMSFYSFGWTFVEKSYLYHFTRNDSRHNFSIFFYPLYLAPGTFIGKLALVPSFILMLSIPFTLARRDLSLSLFLQIFCFVAFNKVITAQYFLWVIALLPLCMDSIQIPASRGVLLSLLWICAELHWLAWASALEIEGKSVFLPLWVASLMFLMVNAYLISDILSHSRK